MCIVRAGAAAEQTRGKHLAGDVADREREVRSGTMDVLQVPAMVHAHDDRNFGGRIAGDDCGEQRRVIAIESQDQRSRLPDSSLLEDEGVEDVADDVYAISTV